MASCLLLTPSLLQARTGSVALPSSLSRRLLLHQLPLRSSSSSSSSLSTSSLRSSSLKVVAAAVMAPPATMKAYGLKGDNQASNMQVVEIPLPQVGPRDLLVKVHAVSFNPVDLFMRAAPMPGAEVRVLGYDGTGVVEEVGSEVNKFKVGDAVYFSGSPMRQGTNAEYVAVDERIVGLKPSNLSWEEAATVPLVSITVWESLFQQLHAVPYEAKPSDEYDGQVPPQPVALIVGGAGGVGSIAIQVAKKVLNYKVVATASRDETETYARELGADVIINHKDPLKPQLEKAGISGADYVLNGAHPDYNLEDVLTTLGPLGGVVSLLGRTKPLDLSNQFTTGQTVTFETMFLRSGAGGPGQAKHGVILEKVRKLIEDGTIKNTLTKTLHFWTQLPEVHEMAEKGQLSLGKVALTLSK
eukprot:jgi/Chlat1/2584/Chrsp178S02449